jgi:polyhydroxyalkanoate synthesis repressor PhaR
MQQREVSMTPARVVVKKYGNRRLYDTSSSSYVNLEDLAKMVRNGTDVQVVDATTGEDLTRVVLTQIIMEDAKDQPTGLPLELLKQLIVASDHVGKEFIMWYLKSAFDAYQKMQGAFQTGMSGMQAAATSPVDTIKNFFLGQEKKESSETEELRRRLAELEARLAEPVRTTKAKKSSKKKRAKKDGT